MKSQDLTRSLRKLQTLNLLSATGEISKQAIIDTDGGRIAPCSFSPGMGHAKQANGIKKCATGMSGMEGSLRLHSLAALGSIRYLQQVFSHVLCRLAQAAFRPCRTLRQIREGLCLWNNSSAWAFPTTEVSERWQQQTAQVPTLLNPIKDMRDRIGLACTNEKKRLDPVS